MFPWDLHLWQRGVELMVAAYDSTSRFPVPPGIVLRDRIREAAVAVPVALAEYSGPPPEGRRGQSLRSALRSLAELHLHLEIARVSGFLQHTEADTLALRVEHLQIMIARRSKRLPTGA
jgi:four helix bundle protein